VTALFEYKGLFGTEVFVTLLSETAAEVEALPVAVFL